MKLEQIKKQIDKLTEEEKQELVDYINQEVSTQSEPGQGPEDPDPD